MPFDVAVFVADTQHLTQGEVGSYFLLLAYQWAHGGKPIPGDWRSIRSICRIRDQRSSKVERVLAMFEKVEGGYSHPRVLKDLERLDVRYGTIKAKRKNASGGDAKTRPAGTERRKKNQGDTAQSTKIDSRVPNGNPNLNRENPLSMKEKEPASPVFTLPPKRELLARQMGVWRNGTVDLAEYRRRGYREGSPSWAILFPSATLSASSDASERVERACPTEGVSHPSSSLEVAGTAA